MTDFSPQLNQSVRMVGPGPHTVNLPPGAHGRKIFLGTATEVPARVTINANVADAGLRLFDGTLVTTTTALLVREMFELVYQGTQGLSEWYLRGSTGQTVIGLAEAASTSLGTSWTKIDLTAAGSGESQLWTVEADGTVTANYAVNDLASYYTLEAELATDLALVGNNSLVVARLRWLVNTGLALPLLVEDSVDAAHSRSYAVRKNGRPWALWKPTAGDNVELQGIIEDQDGASTADVAAGLVRIGFQR